MQHMIEMKWKKKNDDVTTKQHQQKKKLKTEMNREIGSSAWKKIALE